MTEKRRILPQWTALTSLHVGWNFSGEYRPSAELLAWLEEAQWPESLAVELRVEEAGRRQLAVEIALDVDVLLRCQRCTGPWHWQQKITQRLLLVAEEKPDWPDPQWVLEEERVYWHRLLESEISLALPDYPRHSDCDLHTPEPQA